MPIKIELRKSNRIVTLNSEGKAPILSRSGSFSFHTPMELLCIAYGACVGKEIWNHFHFNNLDVNTFESFVVTMENHTIYLTVQHPKDISDELKDEIERLCTSCEISKQLSNTPIVRFIENEASTEELRDESKRGCCGGHR